MNRELTKGEVNIILDALQKRAEFFQERADTLLGGISVNELLDADNQVDGVSKLAEGIATRAKAYQAEANKSWNLVAFLSRNTVNVECLITIPEQA